MQIFCGHCHWRVVFFHKFTRYVNNVQVCATCHKRFEMEQRARLWDEHMGGTVTYQSNKHESMAE